MNKLEFFTIGAFGSTEPEFFEKIKKNRIDLFCDIRAKRGVRGSEYAFVNSVRLQQKLSRMNINYIHEISLAAPDSLRKMQVAKDKKDGVKQRKRESLSQDFITAYEKQVLDKFPLKSFVKELERLNARRVVLFCVEENHQACHRWLVAEKLQKQLKIPVIHL